MFGHVMVRKTKKMPAMSPDPFLACVVGSGNETKYYEENQISLLWPYTSYMKLTTINNVP